MKKGEESGKKIHELLSPVVLDIRFISLSYRFVRFFLILGARNDKYIIFLTAQSGFLGNQKHKLKFNKKPKYDFKDFADLICYITICYLQVTYCEYIRDQSLPTEIIRHGSGDLRIFVFVWPFPISNIFLLQQTFSVSCNYVPGEIIMVSVAKILI